MECGISTELVVNQWPLLGDLGLILRDFVFMGRPIGQVSNKNYHVEKTEGPLKTSAYSSMKQNTKPMYDELGIRSDIDINLIWQIFDTKEIFIHLQQIR